MGVRTIVLFIIPCALLFGISANGSDCKSSADCGLHEFCDKGSCRCSTGFVRHIEKCFPVKLHGEDCLHDVQCNDYRMICSNEESEVLKKFCVCDMYYIWNATLNECLEISNVTQIGEAFRQVHSVSDALERSAEKVFLGVVLAGLICVSILLSFIGICSVYGCCQRHEKGRYGGNSKLNDQVNEVAVVGLPGTFGAIETDLSAMDMF